MAQRGVTAARETERSGAWRAGSGACWAGQSMRLSTGVGGRTGATNRNGSARGSGSAVERGSGREVDGEESYKLQGRSVKTKNDNSLFTRFALTCFGRPDQKW